MEAIEVNKANDPTVMTALVSAVFCAVFELETELFLIIVASRAGSSSCPKQCTHTQSMYLRASDNGLGLCSPVVS